MRLSVDRWEQQIRDTRCVRTNLARHKEGQFLYLARPSSFQDSKFITRSRLSVDRYGTPKSSSGTPTLLGDGGAGSGHPRFRSQAETTSHFISLLTQDQRDFELCTCLQHWPYGQCAVVHKRYRCTVCAIGNPVFSDGACLSSGLYAISWCVGRAVPARFYRTIARTHPRDPAFFWQNFPCC